jgi:hypothetical protein
MYVERNIEARSSNRCYRGKAISITYSESVSVALVMKHVKRMRRISLSSVACPAPHCHTRHDFRGEKVIEHKMCVLIFSATFLFLMFLILRRLERDIIVNVHGSLCKVPVIVVRFS